MSNSIRNIHAALIKRCLLEPNIYSVHSKKCWVVLTQFWVKYGQTRDVGLKM